MIFVHSHPHFRFSTCFIHIQENTRNKMAAIQGKRTIPTLSDTKFGVTKNHLKVCKQFPSHQLQFNTT